MIIIINGSLGVGKTTTAENIHYQLDKSICLDGDQIGHVHPFEIYDDARVDHLYRTLALLIGFHQTYDYPNFVINYVFESAESLEQLLELLRPLDENIHVFWLTCEREVQKQRIEGRSRALIEREKQGLEDSGRELLDWEIQRFTELQEIQRKAAARGYIGQEIDTTRLSAAEASRFILDEIGRGT